MKILKKILLGAMTSLLSLSLAGCGAFFGEEETGYTLDNIISTVDDEGNIIVTFEFFEDEKDPISFTIPKAEDGSDGASIENIESTFDQENNRVIVTVSFTDNRDDYLIYIPVYNGADGEDGRGIKAFGVEEDVNGNQLVTITFTDNSAPVTFTIPAGKNGNGIANIETRLDLETLNTIVTITYTDSREPTIFTIPRGPIGISINYVEVIDNDTSVTLRFHFTDETTQDVTYDKAKPNQWLYGNSVPNDNIGSVGDFYFVTTTGEIYVKEISDSNNQGTWVFLVKLEGVISEETTKYCYITLDPNGGSFIDENEPTQYKIEEGHSMNVPLPLCEKEGYEFIGWYTDKELTPNSGHFTNITQVFNDMILYAQYEEIK